MLKMYLHHLFPQARTAVARGDMTTAHDKTRTARSLIIASVVCGVTMFIILGVFIGLFIHLAEQVAEEAAKQVFVSIFNITNYRKQLQ